MDVRLSDDQQLLRSSIREFAERELRPHVMEWDEAQQYPRALLAKCAELGLIGTDVPEEYGGLGLDKTSSLVVSESVGRLPSWAVTFGGQTGGG